MSRIRITIECDDVSPEDIYNDNNIVVNKNGLIVWITDGMPTEFTFAGLNLTTSPDSPHRYEKNWAKGGFTQFHGTITIKAGRINVNTAKEEREKF